MTDKAMKNKEDTKTFSFRRADFWLAIAILLIILLLWVAGSFLRMNRMSEAGTVSVYYENELIGRGSLEDDFYWVFLFGQSDDGYSLERIELSGINQQMKEQFSEGYNLILVQDHTVRILFADCPDLICQNHTPIRYNGESIICLPHKLTVVTSGDASHGGIDTVTW